MLGLCKVARADRNSGVERARRHVCHFSAATDRALTPCCHSVKALLIAAVLHKLGRVRLLAVVANGGQQPRARAKLALCVLDQLGIVNVPVGIGSEGKPHVAKPHEYALDGYEAVDESRLVDGNELLLSTLRAARPKSISVICISSLRDMADICTAEPSLVLAKVRVLAIQGGLERAPAATAAAQTGVGVPANDWTTWRPDAASNNEFDREASERLYRFGFERGLPMNVISRHAVPVLPMQLAKSFAIRTSCPVMRYLADAQFLGLDGLWQNLCTGRYRR